MKTNTHNIWNYVALVGRKTCVIDCNPVFYTWARCATVCFDSAESLNVVIKTMFVLKRVNLHWSCLVSAKYVGCKKLGHILLVCPVGRKKISSFPLFSGQNILLKAGSSLEMKPTLLHSLASLAEHVNMLAKRLDIPEPTVSQLSFGCQLLVTLSSQNQRAGIVMSEGLGVATGDETVVRVVVFDLTVILKMEETLNNLSVTIMSFLAKIGNANSNDIIHWHKERDNLVSIFMESKLKEKICPWIVNKFNGVQVFISGLKSGYLDAGIVVVMNSSLVRHVCKISEVSGRLLSIKLLFKNKLSVSILGLYTGASLVAWFFQAGNINFFIVKAVNKSSFVIFGGDFNKDGSHKYASFKKCLDFGLVNVLGGSFCVVKTIDYVFISLNLVNAVINCGVFNVKEYFDIDHQAVLVLVSLGGLLDDCWKYNCKDADDIKWAKFKNDMVANAVMFCGDFFATRMHSNLDAMWVVLHKVLCLSTEAGVIQVLQAGALSIEWKSLDSVNASVVKFFFLSDFFFDAIQSVLSKTRKLYCSSKMSEAECIKESRIRLTIDKRMKNFKLDKGHTIRSVLECLFCKVTLDHLVVDNKLVLEPNLVKTKVDMIMEG
ncbi:hypothetical protein G9A89_022897 [Geosiphon pyriformis]|nr:hypothetical protein G9A89_022897 [Geosiphon pyriformis]